MKTTLLLAVLFISGFISAQTLDGAWKLTSSKWGGMTDVGISLNLSDDYFAFGREGKFQTIILFAAGEDLDSFRFRKIYETLIFLPLPATSPGLPHLPILI